MWSGIGSWRGYLRPTLDFWPVTAELAEEMRPVRQGLGDLLLQSQMLHSGIGVFYSVPSALSPQLENGREFVNTETTHQVWTQLTYDLGLDFRYLTSGMLKRGALTNSEFKVLLLPMSQAIAPDEAEAIRAFASKGGTVIADVRPGIYDGHCKPMTPGVLDDLFGIQRTGRGKAAESPATIKASVGKQNMEVELPKVRLDTEVQPATAQALGMVDKTPVLLVNKVGAGQAILLNFQLLPTEPRATETAAARQLLGLLYKAAGARSAVTSAAPDGGPMPLTETRVWQDGGMLVFGMWRQMENRWFSPQSGTTAGEPQPARVTLPAAKHVYDLRAHKYLGSIKSFDTRLRWGRASFYAAAPYQIKGLKVALSSSAPKAGETITASLRLDIPRDAKERHAVWVEVTDPQGQRPFWGQQVVMLQAGAGQVQIPVAYNDAPGKWRIRATELFSNQSAEAGWTIK